MVGAFAVVGFGLKIVLDEARVGDERTLKSRKDIVQGLDKEEDVNVGFAKEGQGKEGGDNDRTEEEEDEKPQTLLGLTSERWFSLGLYFLMNFYYNWRRVKVADSHPSFVMTALVYNICVEVFGLFALAVASRTSRRLHQVIFYALLSCLLVDVALSVQGHTRFIGEPLKSMFPMNLVDSIGLPLWSRIYPSMDVALFELVPIYMMWYVVKDSKRIAEGDAKNAADVERELQRSGGSHSLES
ncbi:hypothetical protein BGZ96_004764 [Linnemannia gamsii]|uniref:Uncharacterized protein n=1 Tax=Linnemannia gamsii TaxID=64522 RepID=A0ABQ7JHZ8_9FUNG|nr:hypothetical protein BGZ96_004764 [Linnemannia gamsii]